MFDHSNAMTTPAATSEVPAMPIAPAWRLHRVGRFRGRPGEIANEGAHPHVSIRYIEEGHATAWIDGAVRKLAAGDVCLIHRDARLQIYHDPAHPIAGIIVDCSGTMIDQLLASYGLLERAYVAQASVGPAMRSLQGLAGIGETAQRRAGLALHEMIAQLGERVDGQPAWPEVVRVGKAYIDDNVDSPLRLADVARHARCSEAHLSRMFRRFLGVPPGDYSLRQRMALAKRLLLGSDASIKSIANRLGYRDTFAFSHAFKNVEGTAPTLWRSADQRSRGLARAS